MIQIQRSLGGLCAPNRVAIGPALKLALVSALTLASCTNSGEVSFDDGSNAENEVGVATGNEALTDDDPVIEVSDDPEGGELVYSCAGRQILAADFVNANERDPVSAEQLASAGFEASVLGDANNWLLLDSGLALGREPLATTPQALVLAEPGSPPIACVAIRAGAFDLRPVAWEVLDGVVAIESCVEPTEVTTDRRQIGGQEVLGLFAPFSNEDPTSTNSESCLVDGSVELDLDVSDDVASSFVLPLAESQATTWQILGFGRRVAELDPVGLSNSKCRSESLGTEAYVEWGGVAAGFDVTVVADGQDLFTSEQTSLEQSGLLDQALNQWLIKAGVPASSNLSDAKQQFGSGFSDFLAPAGGTRAYELRIEGGGIDPVLVSCGSAGIVPGGSFATPTTQAPPTALGADLETAADVFSERAISPYAYFRLKPICVGCSPTAIELQMIPGGTASGPSHVFDPPLESQAGGSAEAIISPFELHERLLAAERAGAEVSFTIDPQSGLPVTWLIDGVGGEFLCFEVDTAPPDLRSGQSCQTSRDLLAN